MPIEQSKLLALLPQYDGQDAAVVASTLSAPILTPRTTPVTWASLASSAVWGIAKAAAFHVWIDNKIANDQTLGPVCKVVSDMLGGPGFAADDPQAGAIAAELVSNGACSQDDANLALNTISYPCGDVVQVSDVANSRAVLAAMIWYLDQVANWNDFNREFDQYVVAIQSGQTATRPAGLIRST